MITGADVSAAAAGAEVAEAQMEVVTVQIVYTEHL